jgi:hypothetical protein
MILQRAALPPPIAVPTRHAEANKSHVFQYDNSWASSRAQPSVG